MKSKIWNVIRILLLFFIGAVLSHFLCGNESKLIIDNEFLVTFVGVILGIAATIITFIFSSTDKIWSIINNTYSDKIKAESIQVKFKYSYKELVEDSNYIFIIFLIVLVCMIWSYIDIPFITFPRQLLKSDFLNAIKMGAFLNCIVATCDLFFSFANILKLALYEKLEKNN